MSKARPEPFVEVDPASGQFSVGGLPYRFIGTNFWCGSSLGSRGFGGDPPRVQRELDRLTSLGVRNLRVMAGSEGPNTEPWRMVNALQPEPGRYDEQQFLGLDVLLHEMAKRRMHAVLCLGNMWQWSGGFAAYVAWAEGGGPIPYPAHSNEPEAWELFQSYASRFYVSRAARELYARHVETIVKRTNSVNGVAYREDPTIMAWQLANEPRGHAHPDAYAEWVAQSARLIKSLDPRHLLSIGSEGKTPWHSANTRFEEVHALDDVDYATCHLWAQNWMWYLPSEGAAAMRRVLEEKALPYLDDHRRLATKLNKPLVLEEFGLSRDRGSCDPLDTALVRDEYYDRIFEAVGRSEASGNALAGANFWAWSGEGRPVQPGEDWKPGDPYTGDPPHEPQGWYGVYDRDDGTLAVIQKHASRVNAMR